MIQLLSVFLFTIAEVVTAKKNPLSGLHNLPLSIQQRVHSLPQYQWDIGSLYYYVSFIDGNGDLIETEISAEIYNEFLNFYKEDEAKDRSDRRHLEKSEQTEMSLNLRSFAKGLSMDKTVIRNIRNEDLHNAINKLPTKQQRRVEMYFFRGNKLREIGIIENCTPQAVHKTLKEIC